MPKFTLVGVDSNAFSVVGYTSMAMKRAKLEDQIEQMRNEAMSGDYSNLLYVCMNYIEKVNKALGYAD